MPPAANAPSAPRVAARPPAAPVRAAPSTRPVARWLLACCLMVLLMIVVGGVTRLTHSGLSITEWQPLVGTLPPLSAADWQVVFEKYKLTPEFKLVNHAMTVDEFKGIFWWEYFHRLLGRLIGVVFLLPLLWFWATRRIDRALAWRLLGIFILGGLQGAMGWYMVKSGLVDNPRVSQFRLTAHLSLAFAIFAAMFWTALSLLHPPRRLPDTLPERPLARMGWWVTGIIGYMIVTGGFVAGIRAGLAYNTFPLMNGHFFPPESFLMDPLWMNFFWNMALVQFDHRLGAWILAFLVPAFWVMTLLRSVDARTRRNVSLLMAMLVVQIALGAATVLLRMPIWLAALHQCGAVLLLAAALSANHALRRGV
jgi:cytochrome c oxidase assembly protein subunit 15